MLRFFFALLIALPVFAQTCSTRPIVPVSARAEGYAELMGDMVVNCAASQAPVAEGTTIPLVDIVVTLSVPVTNRRNAGDNYIDALLLMDEPHSVANPNVPLSVCVDCSMTGTGNGVGVYSGAAGRHNVFQGELTGANTVRFRVPFERSQPRTLRVVNLRGDVTRVPTAPNLVSATMTIPGATTTTQNLAMVHPGIVPHQLFSISTVPASWCTGANRHLLTESGTSPNPLTKPQFVIGLAEGSSESWRAKSAAVSTANLATVPFTPSYPADGNQNITGFPFDSEAGFHNNGASNPGGEYPQLPANPGFPAVRGLQRAGLANQGTRFIVRVSNPPAGMKIFLPVSLEMGDSGYGMGTVGVGGLAVMIASDQSSNFVRVTPNGDGLATMTSEGSGLVAVYEIVRSDPKRLESVSIPVYLAATSIPGNTPSLRITAELGPKSSTAGADVSAVIPRFAEGANLVSLSSPAPGGSGCNRPDLSVSANIGRVSFPGEDHLFVEVTNTSPIPPTGPITVQVTPPPNVAFGLGRGDGWVCTPSPITCTKQSGVEYGGSVYFPVTIAASAGPIAGGSVSISNASDGYAGNNTAEFQERRRAIYMATEPNGMLYTVNSVHYSGRQVIPFQVPTTMSTIPAQVSRTGFRYDFTTWSNNQNATHTLTTIPSDPLVAKFTATSSSMSCVVADWPGLLRAEARTEIVDQFVLNCTGGVPVPRGLPVPPVDIRFSTAVPITSRIVFPGVSEALLVIGEPRSSVNPNVPLLACGASGSGNNASGECAVTSADSATYDGTAGRPNVFQGLITGSNSILFSQVPINPPGPGKTLTLRISNLKLNVSALAVRDSLFPTLITPTLSFSPEIGFLIPGSGSLFLISGFEGGFEAARRRPQPVNLQNCRDANAGTYFDSSRPLDSASPGGFQTRVVVVEGFPTAFRPINRNTQLASVGYFSLAKQDQTDGNFGTETDLYAGPGGPLNTGALSLGSSPEFPAFRGLNTAGAVDSGTRIFVKFTGIPARVKLFIPVAPEVSSTIINRRTGSARLIFSGPTGSGAFSPIGGNAAGLVELQSVGGTAVAFYEVVAADPSGQEKIEIAVAAAIAGSQQPADIGSIRVETGFAPLDATDVATGFGTPIPRFRPVGEAPYELIQVGSCAQPDLTISAMRSGRPSQTTTTNYDFTVRNIGGGPSSGMVSLAIAVVGKVRSLTGSGWSCNVAALSCSRSDTVASGAALPPVRLVLEPYSLVTKEVVTATVTSGVDSNTLNNSFTDTSWVGGARFFEMYPRRLADTRLSPLGAIAGQTERVFQVDPNCQGYAAAYVINVTVVPKRTLGFLTIWPTGSPRPLVSTMNSLDGRVKAAAAVVPAGFNCSVSVYVTEDSDVILDLTAYFELNSTTGGWFYPVHPCRVVDSRSTARARPLAPLVQTTVNVTGNSPNETADCGLPRNAVSFSMNATVVPKGPLGFLTVWPWGPRPTVSTLNAVTGTVVANATLMASVESDFNSSRLLNLFATEATDYILDLNGYFSSNLQPGALNFYPVTPCRISDSRNPNGPFGGPAHAAKSVRDIAVSSSDCGIPSTAKAYVLNATIVPNGPFGYLTLWPTGSAMPVVSTLNALDGAITSNLAIVPAGTNGAISAFVTDNSHLILDVSGYFAP